MSSTSFGAIVHTRSLLGLHAHAITVECHVGRGLPGTTIVGLPQGAVREARDRVKSALQNLNYDYPDGNVVINLAPGDVVKTGTLLDLPIAISLLAATGQVPKEQLPDFEFVGELGLFGELRKVPGAVACALAAIQDERKIFIPHENRIETALLASHDIGIATNLRVVADTLNQRLTLVPPQSQVEQNTAQSSQVQTVKTQEIVGQQAAKRAIQLASAGGHHLLMIGPPGTGKTMLANNMRHLLPKLSVQQSMEVASIYSAAGLDRVDHSLVPFRNPHHSASAPALVGGGNPPMPGEVALAHHGVLFLDELPHFKPAALNLLREPIETGEAVIARASYKVRFPCRFQLVAAMNPCPAGRSCKTNACRCTQAQVQRYQGRISGPLLDRIDIQVRVPELDHKTLVRLTAPPTHEAQSPSPSTPSQATDWSLMRAQVAHARQLQIKQQGCLNCVLAAEELHAHMDAANLDTTFLHQAIARYQLSARSYHKLWRIARTIADLDSESDTRCAISIRHMTQALGYRSLDWENGV